MPALLQPKSPPSHPRVLRRSVPGVRRLLVRFKHDPALPHDAPIPRLPGLYSRSRPTTMPTCAVNLEPEVTPHPPPRVSRLAHQRRGWCWPTHCQSVPAWARKMPLSRGSYNWLPGRLANPGRALAGLGSWLERAGQEPVACSRVLGGKSVGLAGRREALGGGGTSPDHQC